MKQNNSITVVFITVFTGFIGFSLPFPIFSYLFLVDESELIPTLTSDSARLIYLGIAIALFPVGQAIASPYWGGWSDRYGRKRMLRLSLLFASFGMLIVALAIQHNLLYLVFIGRFISGLGEGNITIAQSIASDVSDETKKAKYFAIISIAMNAGWIVGPLLGGVLSDPNTANFTNPTLPFWLAAIMYMINIAVVTILIKETQYGQRKNTDAEVNSTLVWSDRILRSLLLLTFLSFFGTYIMFSFFAPYIVQVFESTPTEIGVYSALLSIPLIVAGMISARINTYLGVRYMTFLALVLLSAGLMLIALPTTLIWLIIPATITAFGIVFIEVTTAILISKNAPEGQNGKAMGVYRSTIVIAEIMAAIAGGFVAGIDPGLPFITASIIVMFAILLSMNAPQKRLIL